MLIHLIPNILADRSNVPCSLVDVTSPELGLNLIGGKELTARRPYPNKNYLVACRKIGQKAVNGFLVETQVPLREFTVVTRWAVAARHIAKHSVRYIITDEEFDTVTEEMMLWSATHPSQGEYKSRYPIGFTYGSPLESQPRMEAFKRIKRVGEFTDELDKHGAVIERSELFRLPTVERDRLSISFFGDRMPAIESAFR
ncbi:hypothetical protein ALP90_200106 [Pseudomonas amygdali pv. ulmi]|uniref:Uncharacterized protein n=1 Tax=Pseudomonas amygdali pv. ulmi TaxID=251720 RepID=A0A3M4SPJ5_PSEA0|nr:MULTISPECIES: DUF6012 family protein [Pseudomonas syringae group genomosp. 2]RMR16843.1 hypothetical protein ALP90_200106 [Pseudomonas amygdali pv. ulmi]RMU43227.1 hypothetical protein ALP27_02842 [Pseudomonas savastanoi pv. glycinea]